MTAVEKLMRTLLTDTLSGRFEDLERRFQREATDITTLEITVDSLRSKNY